MSENLSSGNRNENNRLTRRRRRIAPRGRKRRRGPKLRPLKPLKQTDRRTTVQSRSAGLSMGKNLSSRREMTRKVMTRRLVLFRAKDHQLPMRKTTHRQRLLQMLQRSPYTRMTDLTHESLFWIAAPFQIPSQLPLVTPPAPGRG